MNGKKEEIEQALHQFVDGNLAENAKHLLNVLGYESKRTMRLEPNTSDGFISAFNLDDDAKFNSERALTEEWESIDLLFQLTEEEIRDNRNLEIDFGDGGIDEARMESYLFFAIKLSGDHYTRTQLSQITREINKPFDMPAMILFQHGEALTFAVIDRRLNKVDESKDVLLKATLIKDINFADPHRAHIDILFDLSIVELYEKYGFGNFEQLHEAWRHTLDTELLNRQFYQRLFDWFEWAISEAKFPENEKRTLKAEEHVIRLITRLLFVWFIKEKGLVVDELFNETQVAPLLKAYDRDSGDSYYRAVLQNLFFATLNTEIGERRFSKGTYADHRNFSVYRYENQMSDPDELLALFAKTPFINGGLFDCLDDFKATRKGGLRVDCFSDKHYKMLSIPNCLFFDEDRGLFSLLTHYKFTVEENTPIEQEVALDPELLGKVFENLLAAYNPETGTTARKQTGSYYTPRVIVDYMVEEALVAALAERVKPTDGDAEFWNERLHYLLDYARAFDDASEWFDGRESDEVVRGISELKILDPAVGSGAFPMGVLHKLTLALRRLDPDNRRWEKLQKELAGKRAAAAFETSDQRERDAELSEISETFERYRKSDFGRKLYLIQNSIFGVDIQSIACQIAKLRFFISLTIEQEPTNEPSDNFGIKPLPNLETRFVAANTLIGLKGERTFKSDAAKDLERKLRDNRERHFHASNRDAKKECEKRDKKFRKQLAKELEHIGMPADDAGKVANWDPYDQNSSADWFDSEWMFGITDGFDVVIGNPPYIQLQKNSGELGILYKDTGYETFARTGDIYQLFYEKGCQLLKVRHGLLAYITSNSWLKAKYGKALRRYLSEQYTPLRLLEMGKDVFEYTIVDTSILLLREENSNIKNPAIVAVDMEKLDVKDFPPKSSLWGQARLDGEKPWSILSPTEQRVLDKVEANGTLLWMWDVKINRGITTGYNDAFIIDDATREALVAEDPNSTEIIKPILRGQDIQRYQAKWAGLWLIYSFQGIEINKYPAIKSHLARYKSLLEKRTGGARRDQNGNVFVPYQWYELQADYYSSGRYREFSKDKLFWIELVENGRFAFDDSGIYGEATSFIMTGECIKYLCAVLNGELVRWFLQQVAPTSGMGTLRWKKVYVETIPIPKISAAKQRPLTRLVDRILAVKADNPDVDVSELENDIDRIVYSLYDLTPEEIAIVEENTV